MNSLLARVFTLVFMTYISSAYGGNSSSGGGNQLVARFVSLSNVLLKSYQFPPEELELLTQALNASKIVSVKEFRDPQTGQVVANQEPLIAYSSPGFIQLKENSSNTNSKSFEALLTGESPIAHQIAHELYRASGKLGADGKSIDESYQLSIGSHHLDTFPLLPFLNTRNSESPLKKSLLESVPDIKPNGHFLYCENDNIDGLIFAETTNNNYVLVIRNTGAQGNLFVGSLLKNLDSKFSSLSKGNYLQLKVTVPVTVPNPPAEPFPVCFFDPRSSSLVECGLGRTLGKPILSDGVHEKEIDDTQVYFTSELRTILRSRTPIDNHLIVNLTLYGNAHPFSQGGFTSSDRFWDCSSR